MSINAPVAGQTTKQFRQNAMTGGAIKASPSAAFQSPYGQKATVSSALHLTLSWTMGVLLALHAL